MLCDEICGDDVDTFSKKTIWRLKYTEKDFGKYRQGGYEDLIVGVSIGFRFFFELFDEGTILF